MARILVVDDDPHIRELVCHYLERDGFTVCEAGDGEQALRVLEATRVDLVVLDVMMPRLDGFAFCRQVRAVSQVPLLMLTAKGQTVDKVKGLQLGADDYVVKPFEPLELVARVRALLRRYQIATEHIVQVGNLLLDERTRQVSLGGEEISLPPKEFELLFKLASHAGRTLSREQLIEDIWGYDFAGDERTVDVHIKRLRDKFPDEASGFCIKTVRGLGYRLEVGT
ncbi:MAG: response regulator transcription factor [Alicyclobacillus shizuokensis]|nr:response regulator transcription factor [Alicyclobacillus shizuokensis]